MSLQQFSSDLHNQGLSSAAKHASLQNFTTYFDSLRTAAIGKRNYTDKQLSEHIFKRNWSQKQEKLIFEKNLVAAHNTLHRLNAKVTPLNFDQYEYLLIMLIYDLYDIVAYVEINILKNTLNFSMGRRPDQTAREIYDVSTMMLEIGTVNISSLYLREVFPTSIFLLRQSIEVYGKRLLGYYSITNAQGQRAARVSTQVAWDFIKAETLKPNSRIKLPTDIDIVIKVEEWTNYYIHTGDIPLLYLIENANHFIEPLIYPQNRNLKNYRNSIVFAGTSTISDYNALKADFEIFLNPIKHVNIFQRFKIWMLSLLGKKKKVNEIIVNWRSETSVDATILSL